MGKVFDFIKEAYRELQKVQWPTREVTIRLTGYVIGVSLAVGLFVTGIDYLFNNVLESFFR